MAFGKYISFLKNASILNNTNSDSYSCFGAQNMSACNITIQNITEYIANGVTNSDYISTYTSINDLATNALNLYNTIINTNSLNDSNLNTLYLNYQPVKLINDLSLYNENAICVNTIVEQYNEKLTEISANINTADEYFEIVNRTNLSSLSVLSTEISDLSTEFNLLSSFDSEQLLTADISPLSTTADKLKTTLTTSNNVFQSANTRHKYIPNTVSSYILSSIIVYNNILPIDAVDIKTIIPEDIYYNLQHVNGYDTNTISYISSNYNIYYLNSRLSVNDDTPYIKCAINTPEYAKSESYANSIFSQLSIYIKNTVSVGINFILTCDSSHIHDKETCYRQRTVSESDISEYSLSISFCLLRNTISIDS